MAVAEFSPPHDKPPNPLAYLPCALPVVGFNDDPSSLQSALKWCSENLDLQNLSSSEFASDAILRDTFALTGTVRTFYSADTVSKVWQMLLKTRKACNFALLPESPASHVTRLSQDNAWVDVSFTFETTAEPQTSCSGVVSLIPAVGGKWCIWMLRSILEQLKNSPNVDGLTPAVAADSNGIATNGNHSLESVDGHNGHSEPMHFQCVVAGGGQGGLSTGGHLKALGLSYVVIDKQPHIGDSWNTRYDSAKLHTTREYAHLPFERTFDPSYNQFLTKADLARGYQGWVKKYGINVWTSTELKSGSWDEKKKKWTLKVLRGEEEQILTASHVVMAVGRGGRIPLIPKYSDQDTFRGTILHSYKYKSAKDWKGLHGVVVGTANTGHDVAEDMVEAGLKSVTMIQRNATYILPIEHFVPVFDQIYNDKIPTYLADRNSMSMPNGVTRLFYKTIFSGIASRDLQRFAGLEEAGFKTEIYGDLAYELFIRHGGHYLDMGNCKNIVDGLVKVKSDALPQRLTPDGIDFLDGSHLPADVIVFCTGFEGNFRKDVLPEIFGHDMASKLSDSSGVDSEGEVIGMYKPTAHPGLWYIGGGIGQCRYFSRHLALHIKADALGTPFQVYNETP